MENIINEFKENIKILVESGKSEDAKGLLEKYIVMAPDDVETYSILGTIAIIEGRMVEAERILKEGIEIDSSNYDLLFNLACAYELQEKYLEALIHYRKALNENYYSIDRKEIEIKIKEVKSYVIESNEDLHAINIANLDKILFIDFGNNENVNMIASTLSRYGIVVDIAYNGINPRSNLLDGVNPYRKLLGIYNIEELVSYTRWYHYDGIYLFNATPQIKKHIQKQVPNISTSITSVRGEKELLTAFSKNRLKKVALKESVANEYNDITMLIPTYNRPKYLRRWLDYVSQYDIIKPIIHILDSSQENERVKNKEIIKNYPEMNIAYDEFEPSISFFQKMNSGAAGVKTKYVSLCADDDFLTQEGILSSIDVLEDNPELYSVKGRNLFFTTSMHNLIEYDWFPGSYEKKAIDRLEKVTQSFVPSLIYQVFRADNFKKMYAFIERNSEIMPHNDTFREYLFYFMVIATGKVGKIGLDLNIRDKSVPRESEIMNFPHAVVDGSFNENYKLLCKYLYQYLVEEGKECSNFEERMDTIFIGFLVNFLKVPQEYVVIENNLFDLNKLKIGMKKSWVWAASMPGSIISTEQ